MSPHLVTSLILLPTLLFLAGSAGADDAVVEELRSVSVPVSLSDAGGEDPFRDLAAVGAALSKARVVMVGTPTRGDANALAMQIRLVRFLHERLGFDVLAFESGFYETDAGWRDILAGRPAAEVMAETILPNYTGSEAFQPLVGYVDVQARSGRPLRLAGYGLLSALAPDEPALVVALRAALRACAAPDLDPKSLKVVRDLAHDAYAAGQAELPTRAERRAFEKKVEQLGSLFERRSSCSDGIESGLWAQTMRSLSAAAREAWDIGVFDPKNPGIDPGIMTRSARQQAENLLWIVNRPGASPQDMPRPKVIAWSMSINFVRSLDLLTTGDADARRRFDRLTTLGDLVHGRLGDEAYTLALTSYQGQNGSYSKNPYKLLTPTSGSFEDLMHRTGREAAFVDLRELPPNARWLRGSFIARPLSFKELLGIWRRNVDGLLFLRDATPQRRFEAGVP